MQMRMNRRTLLGAAAVTPIALGTTASANDKPGIATSMPILQDIVANVAGEHANVFSIIPANSDPHTWEPNPEDMVRLSESSAFLFFGATLEPFVETGGWRRTVRDNDIPEMEVTGHVELITIDEVIEHDDHEHDLHEGDPHIWLDPLTIVQAVPAIATFLGEVDGDNADAYIANGEKYVAEIEALHKDLEESFAPIPDDRRKLLVLHDAWRYFAARYDFEIIGIVVDNPDSEVSARELADLLQVVQDSGVNVVFSEPQIRVGELEVLAEEGDVEIAVLLTDSFGDGVDSYISLMEFNRDQIVKYLVD